MVIKGYSFPLKIGLAFNLHKLEDKFHGTIYFCLVDKGSLVLKLQDKVFKFYRREGGGQNTKKTRYDIYILLKIVKHIFKCSRINLCFNQKLHLLQEILYI